MMRTPRATLSVPLITLNAIKLCKRQDFQSFLTTCYREKVENEAAAKSLLLNICQIKTRKALATDPAAAVRFSGLVRRFNIHLKSTAVSRLK